MGCGTSQHQPQTVPIKNSLIHLVQTGRNDLIMKKVKMQGNHILNIKLNFRGDTIVHYACCKGNRELIQYLKFLGADFNLKNSQNQAPVDMVKNPQLLKLIGYQPSITKISQGTIVQTVIQAKQLQEQKNKIQSSNNQLQANQVLGSISQQIKQQVAQQNPERNKVRGNLKRNKSRRQQTQLTKKIKANINQQKGQPQFFNFQQN